IKQLRAKHSLNVWSTGYSSVNNQSVCPTGRFYENSHRYQTSRTRRPASAAASVPESDSVCDGLHAAARYSQLMSEPNQNLPPPLAGSPTERLAVQPTCLIATSRPRSIQLRVVYR